MIKGGGGWGGAVSGSNRQAALHKTSPKSIQAQPTGRFPLAKSLNFATAAIAFLPLALTSCNALGSTEIGMGVLIDVAMALDAACPAEWSCWGLR